MEFQSGSEASNFLRSLIDSNKSNTLLQNDPNKVREKIVTLSNGKKMTLKPKSNTDRLNEREFIDSVLGISEANSFVDMKSLYERIRIREKTEIELSEFKNKNIELIDGANELKKLTDLTTNKKRNKPINSLWTEKYRPKKFIDLIGNEKINSNVLKWLNDWNYAVKNGKLIDSNTYGRDVFGDPLKRPRKKILLIHGPPGIGKTTIAQCVCKQLGYEIQEINSSDERSGNIVKDKIKNSLKMRSLNGKDVCLLLDEIDGAIGNESGFIKVLINLLNKDKKVTEEWNSFNKLKFNKKGDFLKRPIIAMCNDIGAHCLEQLKPYCEIISFKKSSKNSIKKRLKYILTNEDIDNINESLLDDLIFSLDGDIRNCINFLQFNSRNLNDGLKDMEINWFQILKDIFNLENKNIKNKKSKSEIFKELMNKLNNSNNELSRVNNGCFNLMLQINNEYDNSINKLNEISDWLFFEDLICKNFQKFDKEEINQYNSITPMKFFQLFANFSDGNFYDKNERFNFKSGENFELRKNINEIVNKLIIEYKFSITKNSLISNELSMLNYILIPNKNNNYNNNNIKEFEKNNKKIDLILKILEELKISFEFGKIKNQNRFKNNYLMYNKLNPDIVLGLIDNNCTIEVGKEGKIGIDVQKYDKEDNNNNNDNDNNNNYNNNINEMRAMPFINLLFETSKLKQKVNGVKRDDINDDQKQFDEPNRKQRQISSGLTSITTGGPIPISTNSTVPISSVDFFKQQYSNFATQLHRHQHDINNTNEGRKNIMSENENRIWVKYHEGFSNAVRKELTWQSLFDNQNS
jgi:chromosome transmission fidelity protein 18